MPARAGRVPAIPGPLAGKADDGGVRSCWAVFLGILPMMLGNGLQRSPLAIRASLEGFPTTVTGILMSGYFAGFLIGSALAPRAGP
jgi:hypothetical protein